VTSAEYVKVVSSARAMPAAVVDERMNTSDAKHFTGSHHRDRPGGASAGIDRPVARSLEAVGAQRWRGRVARRAAVAHALPVSKAFTKEEAPEAAVVVPARAPLPAGAPNYVTPRGLDLLRAESRDLAGERVEAERTLEGEERRRGLERLGRRKADLDERLASAVVVSAPEGPCEEVRFGAEVTLRGESGVERRYQIVGVDEADPSGGRIAFLSPIARALLGRSVGETTAVRTPRGDEELEVLAVRYPVASASEE
jgi:transcription elongation factor GreB